MLHYLKLGLCFAEDHCVINLNPNIRLIKLLYSSPCSIPAGEIHAHCTKERSSVLPEDL